MSTATASTSRHTGQSLSAAVHAALTGARLRRPHSQLDLGPLLVSELPPAAAPRPTLLARLRDNLVGRREARAFERALRFAGPAEAGDLYAMRRRG